MKSLLKLKHVYIQHTELVFNIACHWSTEYSLFPLPSILTSSQDFDASQMINLISHPTHTHTHTHTTMSERDKGGVCLFFFG